MRVKKGLDDKNINYAYSLIVTIVNDNFFYLFSLYKILVGVYCSPDPPFKKAGLMGKKDKIIPLPARKKRGDSLFERKRGCLLAFKKQKRAQLQISLIERNGLSIYWKNERQIFALKVRLD